MVTESGGSAVTTNATEWPRQPERPAPAWAAGMQPRPRRPPAPPWRGDARARSSRPPRRAARRRRSRRRGGPRPARRVGSTAGRVTQGARFRAGHQGVDREQGSPRHAVGQPGPRERSQRRRARRQSFVERPGTPPECQDLPPCDLEPDRGHPPWRRPPKMSARSNLRSWPWMSRSMLSAWAIQMRTGPTIAQAR